VSVKARPILDADVDVIMSALAAGVNRTALENAYSKWLLDKVIEGHGRQGPKTRVTAPILLAIRALDLAGVPRAVIGRAYNFSGSYLSQILNGKRTPVR
jgi:hypothetical protein